MRTRRDEHEPRARLRHDGPIRDEAVRDMLIPRVSGTTSEGPVSDR
jgi:hypothetical protein